MAFANAVLMNQNESARYGADARLRLDVLDEARVVSEAKRGESAAFDALWRAHASAVLRTTYRITRNREDAEDALQDSFLSAFANLHAFDGRSRFSTWLTRIAINASLMIVRKSRSAFELSLEDRDAHGDPQVTNLPDRGPDPEAQAAGSERAERVRQAITALRPSIRCAIELQMLGERSVQETAATMGLTVPAAKSRLNHARSELRESLGKKTPGQTPNAGRSRLPAAE